MVKIKRIGEFTLLLRELLLDNVELEITVNERIIWFQNNPQDTRLANHALTKKMAGKWAFSITDDIRIIYEWTNKTTVRFLAIGSHIKVYKKISISD